MIISPEAYNSRDVLDFKEVYGDRYNIEPDYRFKMLFGKNCIINWMARDKDKTELIDQHTYKNALYKMSDENLRKQRKKKKNASKIAKGEEAGTEHDFMSDSSNWNNGQA